MNLVIDQGNTVCKIAVCDARRVLKNYVLPRLYWPEVNSLLDRHPEISAAIYSSVADVDHEPLRLLQDRLPLVINMDAHTPVPVEIAYDRTTLGTDRVAAVVGAVALGTLGRECLVIDAGTAVTYERISSAGVYVGGNISAGLSLRAKALQHFTSRLPWVEPALDGAPYGHNTQQALALGVMQGLLYEMDAYIDALRAEHSDALVFVSGGDAPKLAPHLRNKTMAVRNLVLSGLNVILEYNK
ncbi:type III pantothenate kinase [Porphyromonas sp. COT-239 OH1446]|uniref:type III pantothenate kinase n=1 Tax=Porphyromonas sp. COT-239 OH1446 TaxID=1515613 RepID=UPI00052DC83B|nr:type III pantothenate kinase [Porphyromonas sp. COT-239 OH1446]KGN68427.1 pantothenate kinase [Porphyromonas sp. COT-239 OH1446]